MVNVKKINDIIIYFADNVSDLTVTKLMKLFYYVDFISFAEKEKTVTNDIYYKLPYGPVPSFIKNEIDTLAFNTELGKIDPDIGVKDQQLSKYVELKKKKFGNHSGFIIVSKKKRDSTLQNLSKYEIELLKKVVVKYGKKTAKYLSDKTHKEKPYLLTNENAVIDYKLAKMLDLRTI